MTTKQQITSIQEIINTSWSNFGFTVNYRGIISTSAAMHFCSKGFTIKLTEGNTKIVWERKSLLAG
jgi:hypothetical protein